jgi:hypothetical protein
MTPGGNGNGKEGAGEENSHRLLVYNRWTDHGRRGSGAVS